jgi:hypothetical protein
MTFLGQHRLVLGRVLLGHVLVCRTDNLLVYGVTRQAVLGFGQGFISLGAPADSVQATVASRQTGIKFMVFAPFR